MPEPDPKWVDLGALVRREVDDGVMSSQLRRVRRRHRLGQARRAAGLGVLLIGAGLVALDASRPAERGDGPPGALMLADGSTATPLSAGTRMAVVHGGDGEVTLALEAGGGRFDVTPSDTRVLRVVAGAVTVTVLGTAFEVRRGQAEVDVRVSRGRVAVASPAGTRELGAGESGVFPLAAPAPQGPAAKPDPAPQILAGPETQELEPEGPPPPPYPQPQTSPPPTAGRKRPRKAPKRPAPEQPPGPDWKELAQAGRYDEARRALEAAGPQVVRDHAADLMLSADVARLTGHPMEAATLLQQLVRRHASDRRAPLAAFTLGRIHLIKLGRPADAARAFADAYRLAPAGELAGDALARETESWAKAGDAAKARAAAERYLKAFPDGRRAAAVRRFGGL